MLSLTLALALWTSAPFADHPDSPAAAPLNVVLVLVDDLGWADLSCQGSEFYRTPNIDRLAAEGRRFTQGYAACAVCSPTRAAIQTGRSPARLGVTDWIRSRFQRPGGVTPAEHPSEFVGSRSQKLLCPPNPYWLDLEERTLAEVLHDHGYATCHVGKWHLGDDAWYPPFQGYDENHGGCDYGQPPGYFDPYRNKKLPQGIPTLAPRTEGEYLTDREGEEASSFIRRHRDRPFFLSFSPYAVHTPIQAKPELVAEYEARPKARQKNPKYAAMLHSVDDAVGRILEALEETGLAERTLIVFTSDNGGLLGPTHNAPLRNGKGFPQEGGIRVPFLVRWPGVVEAGSVSEVPVTSVDVFPTVLEAVGIDVPEDRELDGRSLVSLLRAGPEATLDREALFWHFPHYRGRWVTPYSIVRAGDWKLIHHHEGPTSELFDLGEDPAEEHEISAQHPEEVERLRALLLGHLEEVGAKLPRPNPRYGQPADGRPIDPTRPRVLLLGDSISIGYWKQVQTALADEFDVFRPLNDGGGAENCAGTTNGVAQIDRWLEAEGGRWDLIHFNFGLHDLKRVDPDTGGNSNDPAHPRQAEPEAYGRQLREIVVALKKTGAQLVFATTTPVPTGVRPRRDVEDPARYNRIATAMMREQGIAVNDLHRLVTPRIEELQNERDVHFNAEGSKVLGQEVTRVILERLVRRDGRR